MNNFEQPTPAKPAVDPNLSWSETLGEALPVELETRKVPSPENLERDALLAKWNEKKGPIGLSTNKEHSMTPEQRHQQAEQGRQFDELLASIDLPQATDTTESTPSFVTDEAEISDIRRRLDTQQEPESDQQRAA